MLPPVRSRAHSLRILSALAIVFPFAVGDDPRSRRWHYWTCSSLRWCLPVPCRCRVACEYYAKRLCCHCKPCAWTCVPSSCGDAPLLFRHHFGSGSPVPASSSTAAYEYDIMHSLTPRVEHLESHIGHAICLQVTVFPVILAVLGYQLRMHNLCTRWPWWIMQTRGLVCVTEVDIPANFVALICYRCSWVIETTVFLPIDSAPLDCMPLPSVCGRLMLPVFTGCWWCTRRYWLLFFVSPRCGRAPCTISYVFPLCARSMEPVGLPDGLRVTPTLCTPFTYRVTGPDCAISSFANIAHAIYYWF